VRYSRILFFVALAIVVLFIGCSQVDDQQTNPVSGIVDPGIVSMRLHWDTRTAIQLEAFYALSTSYNGGSSQSIGGYAVSDWNYIYNDLNAYDFEKDYYGANASEYSSYFDEETLEDYGMDGDYGRGGQCRHFADLILYRSGTYQSGLPTYQQVINDYDGSRNYTKLAGQVYVGDLIQSKTVNGHTAVVVAILAGTAGVNVTSVDVVDANWIGGAGNEIIGRHYFNTAPQGGLSDLDEYIGIDVLDLGAN